MMDWFGGLGFYLEHGQKRVTVTMRTWPLSTLDGDWWQVWRERMDDLASRYPGYRVALFCVRRNQYIAGFVPS